jgi:hypothetical protein
MNADLHPMSLGEILDRTFQIYRSKFLVFAGIAAIPALAMMVIHSVDSSWTHLSSLVHPTNRGGPLAWGVIVSLFFYHISSLLGLLILPASAKLASDVILGEKGTFLSSLLFTAMRWRSYLWVAILKLSAQLIIPEFLATVLLFGAALIAVISGAANNGKGVLTFLLLALLAAGCVLFFWLGACLSLSVPSCALEGVAGMGALRRSWSLSKGSRIRIVAAWLMIFATSMLLSLGLRYLLRSIIWICLGHHFESASPQLYVEAVYLLYAAVSAFVSPIYSIAITLIYYDQRIRKEGYDIERMMDAAGLNAIATPASTDGPAPFAEPEEAQA